MEIVDHQFTIETKNLVSCLHEFKVYSDSELFEMDIFFFGKLAI